jgi:uncharacterized Zn finger protein
MAITKKWLKDAATANSYSRGMGYYDDVEDLVKIGNVYSAVIFGTEEYEVTITDFPTGDPEPYCDCPYDHEGICKHIVAVGLNIINGNFEEEETVVIHTYDIVDNQTTATIDEADKTFNQLPKKTFYEEYFLKQDVLTRMTFLRELFAKDEKMRRQFYEFSKPK